MSKIKKCLEPIHADVVSSATGGQLVEDWADKMKEDAKEWGRNGKITKQRRQSAEAFDELVRLRDTSTKLAASTELAVRSADSSNQKSEEVQKGWKKLRAVNIFRGVGKSSRKGSNEHCQTAVEVLDDLLSAVGGMRSNRRCRQRRTLASNPVAYPRRPAACSPTKQRPARRSSSCVSMLPCSLVHGCCS